jgi:cell wall assembly regulator SMI1
MSHWIRCTENKRGETIYVNIANAMSLSPGKKGGTIIAYPGDKDDYVAVSETAEELLEQLHSGSCAGDDAKDDHAD